ncbi:MAG TPA: hypothetical protein VLB47_00780 [Solirubrobacteraceae bacterium]|nr:hypothetical protein [Solirubrobacteraceae bacterium]
MPTRTASDLRDHLRLLQQERVLALGTALADDPAYMSDLEEEIVATHHAYVGSAVVEIARLRARLHGALHG